MPTTREESDAWMIIQGETQERLDRIHAGADALRARWEAEGRGPSSVWELVSSDDEEFGDVRPITPPASPPLTPRGATSKEIEVVNTEIQQPKLGDTPLQNLRSALSTSPKSQARKVQRQRQRRTPVPVSGRVTRSKASKNVAFYELVHDNKTGQRVSSTALISPPMSPGLKQPKKLSQQQKRRSAYRVQKR
ncbi:hypothetical protein MMC11_005550 [Xylographa trunciseda]|nr:hypothetical protein [Xylographa trunciseda]